MGLVILHAAVVQAVAKINAAVVQVVAKPNVGHALEKVAKRLVMETIKELKDAHHVVVAATNLARVVEMVM